MAWIESHDDIWEHHKTIRLCRILGITDVEAVGHLTSLWHFVLRNAWETADLSAWGDEGIEAAARWRKEPGVFVKALREGVGGKELREGVLSAVAAAERGAEATAQMKPALGRSSYLGDRVLGHPDPGAKAVTLWLRAACEALFTR